ncbi:MAG: arginine biosynthesis bifunctional protein ArgJ, partial [Acidobacteriota bacterium]|nr:arginine biosynthesis bifunctional protein ArgJ [Acidobacteriota bacterium]
MADLHPIAGGITAPAGFSASGLHCGIKASGKPDLALVVSDVTAQAAGVFTL